MKAPLEELLDYVAGVGNEESIRRYEEDLFADAADGEEHAAGFIDELQRLLPFIGRHGYIGRSCAASTLSELRARNYKLQMLELRSDEVNVIERWTGEPDLVVTHLQVDVRGAELVDVVIETALGEHVKTFHDVGCDEESGGIYALCEVPLAQAAFCVAPMRTRVEVVESGKRREVATFITQPG